MALSIGGTIGMVVMVDGHELEVINVENATHVQVRFKGKLFHIGPEERVEIQPEVFVSCGLSHERKHDRFTRLAFDAPRSIKIYRIPSDAFF